MGLDELSGNGITRKIQYLLADRTMTPYNEPLHRVRKTRILLFVAVQLFAFGATFAITQTIGASTFISINVDQIDTSHLFSFCCASRGRVSYHYPVVDPITNFGGPALVFLRCRIRPSGQADRISFRKWFTPRESPALVTDCGFLDHAISQWILGSRRFGLQQRHEARYRSKPIL